MFLARRCCFKRNQGSLEHMLRTFRNAFVLAECVAKREWRADWDWSDTSINVWVPKDSTELLNIRLGLNELHHADITFTRSSIVASVSKDLATDERGRSEDCPLEAGWRRVRLSLKADYELHLGDCNGTSPVSFPGDLLPELPTWVEVTGSNITVNCEMGEASRVDIVNVRSGTVIIYLFFIHLVSKLAVVSRNIENTCLPF